MIPTNPSKEKMAEALGNFLSSPQNGIPTEVIEAFGRIVKTKDGILPPLVFLEAVEHSPVAISITDTTANILYANHAFELMTGYTTEEVIGKNQSILSYKITPIEIYQDLWAHLLAHKHWNGVLINRRKDGERYLADLTVAPILGMNGEVSYYMALHRDVTELHELEIKVKNQKVLIETVIDATPVVTVLLDRFGRVLLDNQAYKKLMGDMQGAEPSEIFLDALNDSIEGGFDDIEARRRDFLNVEVKYNPGRGYPARWFSCSGVWVNSSELSAESYFSTIEDTYLLLVANEITTQKYQQEQVRTNALRALMAEQQLLHSFREALSGALFQMQGPINIVTAAIKMMERRGSDQGDPLFQALLDISETGEKVQDVLRNSIPRQEKEAIMPVNLNEVIHDVLDLSTVQMLEKGVVLDWKPNNAIPAIHGHQYGLRSLFKQLIDNAIIAVNEPGCKKREIAISTDVVKEDIVLSVTDTGPGIAENKRISVFEPFYTNWTNKSNSSGMGLVIAQDVAAQHGGYIEIVPSNTEGCMVKLCLPIKTPTALLKEAEG
jgi:nitrogen fixation negative regulator NifL